MPDLQRNCEPHTYAHVDAEDSLDAFKNLLGPPSGDVGYTAIHVRGAYVIQYQTSDGSELYLEPESTAWSLAFPSAQAVPTNGRTSGGFRLGSSISAVTATFGAGKPWHSCAGHKVVSYAWQFGFGDSFVSYAADASGTIVEIASGYAEGGARHLWEASH